MHIRNAAILVLAVLAAAAAIRQLVWKPYDCNRQTKLYDAQTLAASESRTPAAYALARRNIEQLRRVEKRCSTDLAIPMLLAQNHLALEEYGDAITAYQRALKLGRRPEIYQMLGEAQAKVGRRQEAISNLLLAERADPFYRDTKAQRLILEAEERATSHQP